MRRARSCFSPWEGSLALPLGAFQQSPPSPCDQLAGGPRTKACPPPRALLVQGRLLGWVLAHSAPRVQRTLPLGAEWHAGCQRLGQEAGRCGFLCLDPWLSSVPGACRDVLEFQFTPHWVSLHPESSQGRAAETTECGGLSPQGHKSHCRHGGTGGQMRNWAHPGLIHPMNVCDGGGQGMLGRAGFSSHTCLGFHCEMFPSWH